MSRLNLPPALRALARHNAARLTAALALAMPAAAVAAEPAKGPEAGAAGKGPDLSAQAAALQSGPRLNVIAKISDPLVVAAAAERESQRRERAAGPFHPVAAPVSYGSAEAAFGNARGRPHEGQDIFAPAGTPVVAPVQGLVVDGGSDGGRGNWLAIYDPEREQTYNYFHLIEPASVSAGERVKPGQRVGQLGCTGSCFGDHLHFEVRDGRGPYGTAIDPMPMLSKWGRADKA